MIRRALRRLGRDTRGVTALEFAFVVPPMLFLFMGGSEVCYQAYVQSILEGAVQKAGRDSAIQGGAQRAGELDAQVLTMVRTVAKTAYYPSAPTRSSYSSFSNIKPEAIKVDDNHNNRVDPGECFYDINNNNTWDLDPGVAGQGGANDVTIYTVTIRYTRLFPVFAILGWNQTHQLTAKTLLKNQPYASQSIAAPREVCL